MAEDKHKKIYAKCIRKGFIPKHVCEVGVYLPETSNILDFIIDGIKTTLVEPDPKSLKSIKSFFENKPNVTLHPVAVYEYHGELELSQRAASTFVSELSVSPAKVNENYVPKAEDSFKAKCVTFDEIDDGTIDLLSVDTEGSEWYVIKNLKSRPYVISLETHGKYYTNGFIHNILDWMEKNQYIAWYKDGSDTVFVKQGTFNISRMEKIKLKIREARIKIRKFKKHLRVFKKS